MPGEQKKVCIDVPYIDQSKLYPVDNAVGSIVFPLSVINFQIGRIYAVFIEENGFDSIFFDADV